MKPASSASISSSPRAWNRFVQICVLSRTAILVNVTSCTSQACLGDSGRGHRIVMILPRLCGSIAGLSARFL